MGKVSPRGIKSSMEDSVELNSLSAKKKKKQYICTYFFINQWLFRNLINTKFTNRNTTALYGP